MPLPSDPGEQARAVRIFTKTVHSRGREDWLDGEVVLDAELSAGTKAMQRLAARIEIEGATVLSAKNPEFDSRNPLVDGVSHQSVRPLSIQIALRLTTRGVRLSRNGRTRRA